MTGENRLIITMDGPAGSGKSSVSKEVAARLGYRYIDTGAMYRAVAVMSHELGIEPDDDEGLERLCDKINIEFVDGNIIVDGRDLSSEIRTPTADGLSSMVSSREPVRRAMIALQRKMAARGGVVMEGRDIGTVVLPNADAKFYITASPEIRGERRHRERLGKGEESNLDEVIEAIRDRDERDSRRELSPLKPASDAQIIDTSNLDISEVVGTILKRLGKDDS
ncbi:MAG: (d)CMP kinase [Deltaproteobacteria bacterium]|uniref:Cytidylate kinase n=1 Tax=Candidatus Zymogenus saltonus TaxID=2844893 RepID=A0A9D8PMZ0_9DELT|nr:(d)CMP kinase [Candidatus Zymogenus saltonus]